MKFSQTVLIGKTQQICDFSPSKFRLTDRRQISNSFDDLNAMRHGQNKR